MTKSSTALLSLVAAVPGAFLSFLLVMAFLNNADQMGATLNGVVGAGLLCGVAAALIPVGILLFGGPKGPAKPKPPKKPKKSKEEVDDDAPAAAVPADADLEDSSELDGFDSEDAMETSDAFEDDDPLDSNTASDDWDDDTSEGASDEFEFDDGLSDDELEFDFDDEQK